MTILGQIYAVSALVGSAFIIFNFLVGQFGDGSSVGDDGAAGSHDGSLGDDAGTASGHDFSAPGDSGGANSDASGHDFSAADGGDSSSDASYGEQTPSSGARGAMGSYALSGLKSERSHLMRAREQDFLSRLGFLALALLSPMGMAIFLTFFGAAGCLVLHLFPLLGALSLMPAILMAIFISNLFKASVRLMMKHLESSSLTEVNNLIGQVGEINTPIRKGRTGEITYVVNCKLCSSPAKSVNDNLELERGAKVVIVDTKQQVMLVELYVD